MTEYRTDREVGYETQDKIYNIRDMIYGFGMFLFSSASADAIEALYGI